MKFKIKHTTTYKYSDNVSLCQNQARLKPLTNAFQYCSKHELFISPSPDYKSEFIDYYGNHVAVFEIPVQHTELIVTAISEVEILPKVQHDLFDQSMPWEDVQKNLKNPDNIELVYAAQFCQHSLFSPFLEEAYQYALQSFTPGRSIISACECLMARIFNDFLYDPSFTTISTPLSQIYAHKKGVCQDFAHFAIACLRSLGLSSRYVSGYIETIPPEGAEKLEGADATHAWFAVYVPNLGWIDFDPTNNVIPKEQHISLATGLDFSDVTPLKGIVFGGGQDLLSVAVDMTRI